MCGISAIFFRNSNQDPTGRMIREAVSSMKYRGPDQSGFYQDDRIALGVCRLSIVDVTGGAQPHCSEDGNLVLVCNGEIYNHRDLRKQLVARGHRFRTASDVEVILHLYEEKGVGLLEELAGMFALVLWDRKEKIVFAARDRIGIKPLYYYAGEEMVVFASEMKSIVRVLDLSPQIDLRKAWEFLCYGFPVDNESTVDRQIQRLQPAEAMVLSREGLKKSVYWRPPYLNGSTDGHSLNLNEARRCCEQTVIEHLVCEVPSAIMLSGGLDSASIASFAVHLGFRPQALTIGYEGNYNIDEREKAAATAKELGLDITEIKLSSSSFGTAFSELTAHCDEPVADFAAIPQWEIFKQAHRLGYKVLQNGLGGDEIFYGYEVWNRAGASLLQKSYSPFFEEDDGSGLFFHPTYRRCRKFLDDCARPEFRKAGIGADRKITDRFASQGLSGPDRIYHNLFMSWLPNNCLLLADRLSMAHSVELRVPLLDHRLVEYVQGLPLRQRFDEGNGKCILKRIVSDLLGEEVINRPKQGFTPPGPYMFDLIRSSKEIIFEGWLSRYNLLHEKMESEWEKMDLPEIWFRMLTFEKWMQCIYA